MGKTHTIEEYEDLKQRVISLRISTEQASPEERRKLFPELVALEKELEDAKIFEPIKGNNNIIQNNTRR